MALLACRGLLLWKHQLVTQFSTRSPACGGPAVLCGQPQWLVKSKFSANQSGGTADHLGSRPLTKATGGSTRTSTREFRPAGRSAGLVFDGAWQRTCRECNTMASCTPNLTHTAGHGTTWRPVFAPARCSDSLSGATLDKPAVAPKMCRQCHPAAIAEI